MGIYCVFHSDLDGYVSAAQFFGKYGKEAKYYPTNYGYAFPVKEELTKKDSLYILDFSYPAHFCDELAEKTNLFILDHHKTAYENLKGKPYFTFSDDSGCLLSFNYLTGGLKSVPDAVVAANAYDLWLDSRDEAECAFLDLHKENLSFLLTYSRKDHLKEIALLGKYRAYIVSEFGKKEKIQTYTCKDSIKFSVINISYPFISTVLNDCINGGDVDFAVGVSFDACGASISLRGRKGFDVSAIAKNFGGGGHSAAAGFRLSKSVSMSDISKYLLDFVEERC